MTAADIRAGLRRRWPDSQYLHINEAPTDGMRQGRKLDVLVVSLWRSRGYELDGVEIKVDLGDWNRELKEPAKADWWWEHVHRFWLAAPLALAPKIRADLPSAWGLLGVSEDKTLEVVKAPKHAAEPLAWETCIGLLRTCDGAGLGALLRAEESGRKDGYERARREIERNSGDAALRRDLEELRTKVAAFRETSGIDVAGTWGEGDAARLGQITAAVRRWVLDPHRAGDGLRANAARAREAADVLGAVADELDREFAPAVAESVA